MNKIRSAYLSVKRYIFDPSINLEDRSFILFSCLVLLALYAAVPCGLIMREPPSATISTAIGAIVFSVYIYHIYRKNKVRQAAAVLSVIVVLIFLPAMFFTNGGATGGAPIWLLLGTVYIALILKGRMKRIMLILDALVLTACWIVGYFFPDIVTEYSRGQGYFDSIAALFIVGALLYTLILFNVTLFRTEEKRKNLRRLFDQTATALVNAIDAKDEYTHGHSSRVADYSRKIAELAGKSPEECNEIYYVALLHDVGKIGIPESIINKDGKLTDEEYAVIKQHPVLGSQILKSISEYPDLIIGARYHHERYDGRGYPDKLKGEDIPEIARIISVADAYDAMTSKRSYREPIPQQSVREEIVKGSGSQFDPKFAKIMQHLIDLDTEYDMKEKGIVQEMAGKNELRCKKSRDEISDGILLGPDPKIKNISLKCAHLDPSNENTSPAIILFDSLDGRYHDSPHDIKDLNYFEYAELRFGGDYECKGARKIAVEKSRSRNTSIDDHKATRRKYEIEAVKIKDHIQIKIDDGNLMVSYTVALPDSARFAYIGLTGDNCRIYSVAINLQEEPVPSDYITRIAEEVSYIKGPVGDIPNVQVDGYRSEHTEAIPIKEGTTTITFHTMSLPTARLVWHCAYMDLYYSPDKKPSGEGYREYALMRLDGEYWESEGYAETNMYTNISEDFKGWDAWKAANKEGFDCTVSFKRDGNKVVTTTENLGISLKITTTVYEGPDVPSEIYVALTGDQCALTNIRISD